MNSTANSATTAKGEVIALVDVWMGSVVGRVQFMVNESFGSVLLLAPISTVRGNLVGFGEFFFVVVHCPEVHHDDSIFGYKVALIPIVLDDEMVLAHFVDGSPSERFLVVRGG